MCGILQKNTYKTVEKESKMIKKFTDGLKKVSGCPTQGEVIKLISG